MAGKTSKAGEIKAEVAEFGAILALPTSRRCTHVPVETACIYKECRRNHAASFGRHAFDGCGEFMGSNDDPFICAACSCHRSFHSKEPPTVAPNNNHNNAVTQPAPQQTPPQRPLLAPLPLASHNGLTGDTSVFPRVDRNLDAGSETLSGAAVEEEKETKKRAKRTKLTVEQKTKMTEFAEKLGWRPQKQDDDEVEQFCEEIGVSKRVFAVWLNNNRHRKPAI